MRVIPADDGGAAGGQRGTGPPTLPPVSTPSGSWPGGSSSGEGRPSDPSSGSGDQAGSYGSGDQPGSYGGGPSGPGQQGGQQGWQQPAWGQSGPAQQSAPGQQPYSQYPQQYYNAPSSFGAGQQPQQPKSNGFGITALILGIVSIPAAFVFGVPGIVLGIAAIVFAVLNNRRVKAGRADNRGVGIAGLVTGIVGLLLGIVMLIFYVFVFNTVGDCLDQYNDSGDQAQYEQCVQDQFN